MNESEISKLILDNMPRAMHFIRTEMRQFAKGQLTVPQFRVLVKLAKSASFTHQEVADWMGITAATLTRIVDTLVERKLVERVPNQADRRQIHLKATQLGRNQYVRYRAKVQNKLEQKLAPLTQAQKEQLERGLFLLGELFANQEP